MTIMFTTTTDLVGRDIHMQDTLDNLKAELESAMGFENVEILVLNEKAPLEVFDYHTLKERINGNLHIPRSSRNRADAKDRWVEYISALRDAAVIRNNLYYQLVSDIRRM